MPINKRTVIILGILGVASIATGTTLVHDSVKVLIDVHKYTK